ncbi:MAG: DNA/RNA nuclease SfsA [Thermocladium sp.]
MSVGDVVYTFPELREEVIIDRPNRFTVLTGSGACHLHDPGRLLDLVYPGNKVLIRDWRGEKTNCRIAAAWSSDSGEWVVIDSGIHSIIASHFLPGKLQREVKIGHHRLDFLWGSTYVEVKGCTLTINGKALFPDAPTRRGTNHMKLLKELKEEGVEGLVMFLVMRRAKCFAPNWGMDPAFSAALRDAINAGVSIWVKSFRLSGRSIIYTGDLELCNDWASST